MNEIEPANLVFEDEHARRYGYRGAVAAGSSIFAYMSRSLVDFYGMDWLEQGSADVRFVHPIYVGEEVRVRGQVLSGEPGGAVVVDCQAENAQGVICGTGIAAAPICPKPPEPAPDDYPAADPTEPQAITLGTLRIGQPLAPVRSEFSKKVHWEYCQKIIRDHHPLYHSVAHPGWLLAQASRLLTQNFDLPAWIHVSSRVQCYHAQEAECAVETRGRVAQKYERRGQHYVELDVALFAESRCLQTIRHLAIFRIAPRAA